METLEPHEWVVRLGLPLAQGFFYGLPVDPATLLDRLDLASWPRLEEQSLTDAPLSRPHAGEGQSA